MKKRLSIFLVFLAVVFSCNTLGETAVSGGNHHVATVEAALSESTPSTQPFGTERTLATHNSAEGEVCTSNLLSCCNTIYASQEETYKDTLVEEFVQRHATILLLVTDFTVVQPSIGTLLFPFHFFL